MGTFLRHSVVLVVSFSACPLQVCHSLDRSCSTVLGGKTDIGYEKVTQRVAVASSDMGLEAALKISLSPHRKTDWLRTRSELSGNFQMLLTVNTV